MLRLHPRSFYLAPPPFTGATNQLCVAAVAVAHGRREMGGLLFAAKLRAVGTTVMHAATSLAEDNVKLPAGAGDGGGPGPGGVGGVGAGGPLSSHSVSCDREVYTLAVHATCAA